ncbi:MAG: hypothetical protein ACI8RZ_007124, partial [Myxococcota bacterium]
GNFYYDEADSILYGEEPQDYAGYITSGVGDTNGDGYPEVLVSAPFHDTDLPAAGAVYLVQGTIKGISQLSDSIIISGSETLSYSAMLSLGGVGGDINNDGFNEILIGALGEGNNGAVHVIYGPLEGNISIDDADAIFQGPSGAQAGFHNIIGDTNNDGFDDILIGAPYDSTNGEDAGAVYLILGGGM